MAISQCGTATAEDGQELLRHGTALFPAACYRDALTRRPLPWHWHEELEAGILLSGAAELAAGGARFSLAAGDAFFVNTGVPHSLRGAPEGALRSLCFHPRLVGGSEDSVYWQTYLRPVVDGRFPRALRLSGREDRDAGEWIGRAWQAVAEEEAGFELEARYALEQAKYPRKLEVELLPLENFYPAEEYHQKYLDKNPGGYCHIPAKLLHLNEQ